MDKKFGWHHHTEGGLSSGEIHKKAREEKFEREIDVIFTALAKDWAKTIAQGSDITKDDFIRLFGALADKFSLEGQNPQIITDVHFITSAIVEEMLDRNLTMEEELALDEVYKSFFAVGA